MTTYNTTSNCPPPPTTEKKSTEVFRINRTEYYCNIHETNHMDTWKLHFRKLAPFIFNKGLSNLQKQQQQQQQQQQKQQQQQHGEKEKEEEELSTHQKTSLYKQQTPSISNMCYICGYLNHSSMNCALVKCLICNQYGHATKICKRK